MRFFQAAFTALIALVAGAVLVRSVELSASSCGGEELLRQQQWADFKVRYSKEYATPAEEAYRFQVFRANLLRAAKLNEDNPLATFGVSPFVDLDPVEFKQRYLSYRPHSGPAAVTSERLSRPQAGRTVKMGHTTPMDNVDWRTKGAVTPVRDEHFCNAGWAFSAVASVESAWFLKHATLPTLSPQQVLSCDSADEGCTGGALSTAFAYVQSSGLEPEVLYPFNSGSGIIPGPCSYSAESVVANISGSAYATPPCKDACDNQDESTLLNTLGTIGPPAICVNALAWQYYVSGVISSNITCPSAYSSLDHCAQLVGYQTASPNAYWIVRNSWGASWGNQGYVYLAYGKNVCGLADEAMLPTSA